MSTLVFIFAIGALSSVVALIAAALRVSGRVSRKEDASNEKG